MVADKINGTDFGQNGMDKLVRAKWFGRNGTYDIFNW